jgi:hypothetical protein
MSDHHNNVIQQFLGSPEGADAAEALRGAGVPEESIRDVLHHAARAGIEHLENDAREGGILGKHAGMSFFAAFASGLIQGDGLVGSLEEGALGVVVGRITEAITASVGLDSGLADAAAAATAPHVMKYLKRHIGA